MALSKTKRLLQISVSAFLCLLLSACQADNALNPLLDQEALAEETPVDNVYRRAIDAYSALLRGEAGLDGDMSRTIAPTPDTKFTMIDMNDDGIPELAVTTVIFQDHSPDTSELESTALDTAIFSYKDGEVFLWGGGDHRHHHFEILSNRALLYDSNDGHGGREIIYQELDKNGDIAREIELWNSSDGRYYFIDHTQNVPQAEISEEEWHEIADPILALRTDQIQWSENFENAIENFAEENQKWQGESRRDGWRCEGSCINSDGSFCDGFFVRIISPDETFFQEITLSAESRIMPTGMAHWEDVNFDGEFDVLVHLGGGRGGTQGYAAVLWDETAGSYREEPAYRKIENPVPDSEHRIIWAGADSSFQSDFSAWEYLNGELVKTHQLSALYDFSLEGQKVSFSEYELKNGTLSEIHHFEIMKNDLQDIDAVISANVVWEGWSWCDFQRFQQKG